MCHDVYDRYEKCKGECPRVKEELSRERPVYDYEIEPKDHGILRGRETCSEVRLGGECEALVATTCVPGITLTSGSKGSLILIGLLTVLIVVNLFS